jgi:Uma2 family endonuclease
MVQAPSPPRIVEQADPLVVRFHPLFEMTPDLFYEFCRLKPKELERFPRICPDFVVEVASPSDRLTALQAKMEEYIANGAQLGWLLDPASRVVTVYRPDQPPTTLENAATISGDPVLPGFTLELEPVWQPVL